MFNFRRRAARIAVRASSFVLLGFGFFCLSPQAAAQPMLTAFGTSMAIPDSLPEGSIISRQFYTAAQICGRNVQECHVGGLRIFEKGGSVPDLRVGPAVETNLPGVRVQLLGDGIPLTGWTGVGTQAANINKKFRNFEVQLIRGRGNITNGNLGGSGNTPPEYYQIWDPSLNFLSFIKMGGAITAIPGSCAVSNKNVMLDDISLNALRTAGEGGFKKFNIEINNCPPGFNAVEFRYQRVGPNTLNRDGLLEALPSSKTKGVGIKVATEGGNNMPIEFDRIYGLTSYQKTTGGSFRIPLQASYVKTGPTIEAGNIEAAMQIILNYK